MGLHRGGNDGRGACPPFLRDGARLVGPSREGDRHQASVAAEFPGIDRSFGMEPVPFCDSRFQFEDRSRQKSFDTIRRAIGSYADPPVEEIGEHRS